MIRGRTSVTTYSRNAEYNLSVKDMKYCKIDDDANVENVDNVESMKKAMTVTIIHPQVRKKLTSYEIQTMPLLTNVVRILKMLT